MSACRSAGGSVETLIVHASSAADEIAGFAGTKRVPELTHRFDGDPGVLDGLSSRLGDRPRLDPDQIRRLPTGSAWVIRRGRAARVAVARAPALPPADLPPHSTAVEAAAAAGAGEPLLSRRRGRELRAMAGPVLEPWERRLLRLVSEQGAMPFDQLARFLDVEERRAVRVGWHLAERDLVTCRRVLHGEPPWLWLSFRGHRLSGTGLELLRPTPGAWF